MVNGATLGLIIAQSMTDETAGGLRALVARLGEPAIRAGVATAMQRMGEAFVLGRDIDEALKKADRGANRAFRYSFDMLGEGARTGADASAYQQSYLDAISAVGRSHNDGSDVFGRDSVSVKLSALHPRYESLKAERAVPELTGLLIELARAAKAGGVGLTVDAEESERLEMSLSIIEGAARDPYLAGWDGLGMAVQAYTRRAPAVIGWAGALAEATNRKLMVRLVKGAYWDTEIKRGQERGVRGLPRLHPQKRHRRLLHGLRQGDAGRIAPVPRLRHPQRLDGRDRAWNGRAIVATSSSSACTAWARGCTRI